MFFWFSAVTIAKEFWGYSANLDYLKFLMIFAILLKIQFFLRVNPKMGLLVTLVMTCFKDVIYFATYLQIWMFTMTIAYKVLGFTATGYDHIADDSFINFFIQVWENSIGNINPPTFRDSNPSPVRICCIYAMWFTTQFVVLIILLNFLIAVISQSYENVMNSA